MSEQMLSALGHLFLALSDKTRLRLLSLMADGEVSVGFLAESLGESQPKISRHLAYLRSAGIVSTRRDGKWIYYAIARQPEPAAEQILAAALNSIGGGKLPIQPAPWTDNHAPAKPIEHIYAEPYITEWEPAEIDVFLL